MEAGNRCFDDRVPEEVNRRVIDHSSTVLMPYTHRSAENLTREGIERHRVFVTGNPIKEVLDRYADQIALSEAPERLELEPRRYMLATVHRAETVDEEPRLRSLATAFERIADDYGMPIVCSLHPRTADRMRDFGVSMDRVRFVEPQGLFDFVALEQAAFCVLSDSGTVQEECCIFGVPTVTLRDVTERPETIECGSNILSGVLPDSVETCVRLAVRRRGGWTPPPEYLADNVSETVARIIVGHLSAGGTP
jgi:UDP-N-acetylglucosamine 2-epimerase (non-hydrolysing)